MLHVHLAGQAVLLRLTHLVTLHSVQLIVGLQMMGEWEVVSDPDKGLPLVAFHLKDKEGRMYDEFDVADRLRTFGWVVPA